MDELTIHAPSLKNNSLYKLSKVRAIKARKKYNLENGPIITPVFNFLEKENCFVINYDIGKTSVTGLFIKKGDIKLVLIHKNRVLGQQNFTAAHELSHVLFDDNSLFDLCTPPDLGKKDDNEILADFFASHFLMPEEDILSEVEYIGGKISKLDIIYLSSKYRVSFIAMALRLFLLNIITPDEYERYLKQSKKGKLRLRKICEEHGIDASTFNVPEPYFSNSLLNLLLKVYHNANISRSVLIEDYIEPLESAIGKDLSNFVKYAESTYPTEVEWDEI
ncbi:ImmA/IrrE family metallo-endopeptidase [Aeribacillus pallidus]|jgi:Zn-dependent peptidase ImmA (M78 family)|uniref:ImmA/IrrE family metallo-endopeptidase n=2 Tax=Bacillales TaxID=1385 RepID=UPI002E225950|nr:ImmA/IrrE family metallo-endopeptidase [Aeribacillus composti]MED4488153.1 ImmA/IrrE family metallo-endopeptidase [Aeribacillus pallidus]